MESTEGWKLIVTDINNAINDGYQRIANGDKDRFDENKGFLRGLSWLFAHIKTEKEKLRQLNKD